MFESGREQENLRGRYAPLLSFARFGPGSILLLCSIGLLTVMLYMSGHAYLAIISGSTGLVLFAVKSMEIIRLARVEERKLIGQRCLVIKRVGKAGTGVVRVYDRTGRLNPELWSAESTCEIPEGEEAQIEGMRSIVLLIVPGES